MKSLGSKKERNNRVPVDRRRAGDRATHTARLDFRFSETQLDIQLSRTDPFLPLRSARGKGESVADPGTHLPFQFQGSFREGS